MTVNRRQFLQASSCLALAGAGTYGLSSSPGPGGKRILVIVELAGGNDGLNSVIPYSDQNYYRMRAGLAVARDQVIPLDERNALHPSLESLLPAWRSDDLAIIQGVGSGGFDSHVAAQSLQRTIDPLLSQDQWVDQLSPDLADLPGDDIGDDFGSGLRFRASWPAGLKVFRPGVPVMHNDALADSDDLKPALQRVATMINSGHPAVGYRVTQSGFDLHEQQSSRHPLLLSSLAQGLAEFRNELLGAGRWEDVVVMTTTEFGRAITENPSGGTAHGQATAQFLLGGNLHGGLYGAAPDLRATCSDCLPARIDTRSVHAAVVRDWWHLPLPGSHLGSVRPLKGLIRS